MMALDADARPALGTRRGEARHHGAPGNQARRRARHARGPGRGHQPRRAHEPCGAGGAAVRQARGGGRRGAGNRPRAARDAPRRRGGQGRRLDLHRRHHWPGLRRQAADTGARPQQPLPAQAARLGRRVPPSGGVGERRLSARRRARTSLWRAGHRPVPHRAHVLRGGPDADRAAHDHGEGRHRSATRPSRRCCRCSARTSRACSARWTGSR